MVRYGEYSPQNPRCRTSNKLLLGIGEYEERKRLLREQRKQDYEEQVLREKKNYCSQNLLGPNAVSEAAKYNVKFADKCIQVECGIADEPKRINRMYMDECTQVSEEPIPEVATEYPQKVEYNIPLPQYQDVKQVSGSSDSERLLLTSAGSAAKNDIDLSQLSPRERKFLEFCGSGSYNPSFYEKWFPTVKTVPERDTLITRQVDSNMTLEQLKKRTYQDELRKQIEEKKRFEAELKEREREEEEMIAKRVEQQQLKMKMEYEREQAQRKKKIEKRLYQPKEQDNILAHSSRCEPKNQVVEAKNGEMCSDKLKILSLSETHDEGTLNQPRVHPNSAEDTSNNNYYVSAYRARDVTGNVDKQCTEGQISISDNTKGVSHGCSDLAQNVCPKTSPYHLEEKILTVGVKESCETTSVKLSSDFDNASLMNKNVDIIHRKRPVPTPRKKWLGDLRSSESELVSDKSASHSSAVFDRRENLCDSTPIPILEELGHFDHLQNYNSSDENKTNSEAFLKTETKWKIPAVQKNIMQTGENYKDKYHGRILTQLGAFRRQIQMHQLRLAEKLKSSNET